MCLPFFRWAHRFGRPHGTRYELKWKDRIRNYLIGFEEVGIETGQIKDYFDELVSKEVTEETLSALEKERQSPFAKFDHIELLDVLPDNEKDMSDWLVDNTTLDCFISRLDSRYLVYPKLFSLPGLLEIENPVYRNSYI